MTASPPADHRPAGTAAGSIQATYLWLAVITAAFLALALVYARVTPAWQVPDEPAHYNYVAYLASTGQMPILQPGDYPAGIVPIGPEVRPTAISPFRYEAHQPPLFYALAAVIYKLHASVFALRALSALFGAALLPVIFLCARLVLPGSPWLWLGAAGFAGFIPMHLFIAGAVENDTLADLVTSLLLLASLATWPAAIVGLLLGLAALTKVTIYLPAILLAGFAVWRQQKPREVGAAVLVAAAVSGWWFVRNGLTYGWTDMLVQARQAQVAGRQTQTGMFGPAQVWNFIATGFHSFWGQFGWMSIPLPERDYRVLIALTGAIGIGWIVVLVWQRELVPKQWQALVLAWAGTVAGLLIYNLKFVQPQGRYLFPALASIAIFCVVGWAGLFPRSARPPAVGALALAMLAFSVYSLQHDLIPAFR
ncbi:MAG TPA: hypothetical protein VF157_03790 [Chloroflexota bacterium]